jgi:hypothetical protein
MSDWQEQFFAKHTKPFEQWVSEGFFEDIIYARVDECYSKIQRVGTAVTKELKMLGYFHGGKEFQDWMVQQGVTKFFSWRPDRGHGTTGEGVEFVMDIRRHSKKGTGHGKKPVDHTDRNTKKDWSKEKGGVDRRYW